MNDFVVGLVEEHVSLDAFRFSESIFERWRCVLALQLNVVILEF